MFSNLSQTSKACLTEKTGLVIDSFGGDSQPLGVGENLIQGRGLGQTHAPLSFIPPQE